MTQERSSILKTMMIPQIEEWIDSSLESLKAPSALKQACIHSLKGGKRFRPSLMCLVGLSTKKSTLEDFRNAALAIEYFHTAALIADDLPMMDDSLTRRGIPTVHTVFGEDVALLASYTLIAYGYELLAREKDPYKIQKAVEIASRYNGSEGITTGQYLDLKIKEWDESLLLEMIHKKTTALFQLCFALGWIFGNGKSEDLPTLLQAASHFGLAFQLADDFQDEKEDASEKNFVCCLGHAKAKELLDQQVDLFYHHLTLLKLEKAPFESLVKFLYTSV